MRLCLSMCVYGGKVEGEMKTEGEGEVKMGGREGEGG